MSLLEADAEITDVIAVHCETTSGILNPIEGSTSASSIPYRKSFSFGAPSRALIFCCVTFYVLYSSLNSLKVTRLQAGNSDLNVTHLPGILREDLV